jgi:hypothetical protein
MLVFGGGGAAIIALVRTTLRRDAAERREQLWSEVARRLDGRFTPGERAFFRGRSMRIDAVVEGVEVEVDTYVEASHDNSKTYTRVAARAEAPFGMTLRIFEEGLLSGLGKMLGMQDVVVGHGPFDQRFVVKASDEDLARAWLVRSVTSPLCELVSWSHRLERGQVTSRCAGIVENVDELSRAAHATALLAARGAALRAEWSRLAETLGGVLRGEPWRDAEPAIAVGGAASPVFVELARRALPYEEHRLRFVTRVRAHRDGVRREAFVAAGRDKLKDEHGKVVSTPKAARFEVRSSDAAATAARFDEGLAQTMDSLAPDVVEGTESHVSVVFGGVMFDAERLQAAMAIARQLAAAEQTGPYR